MFQFVPDSGTPSPRPSPGVPGEGGEKGRPCRMRWCLSVTVLVTLCSGCASFPAAALDEVDASSNAPRAGQVYLIRGWNGLWSEGLDALAQDLRREGLAAHVYGQGQ